MADLLTPKPMGGLTAREQEILVAGLSKCLKSGDIQASPSTFFTLILKYIDYAKLAIETGLKDAKSANAVWCPIKKKLFGIASTQGGAASGTAPGIVKPKTPRKPKQPKETKTSASNTTGVNCSVKAEKERQEDGEQAGSDAESDNIAPASRGEINGVNGSDSSPASKVESRGGKQPTTGDADRDSTIGGAPGPVKTGKGKASIAEDMSAGDMSPPSTPAPIKAKNTTTPKAKAPARTLTTPRTPKTPASDAVDTTSDDVPKTPEPVSSGSRKRGRKTKAQREAEAAANGMADYCDDEEGEKPVKRPRKTPVKQAKNEKPAENGNIAGTVDGRDRDNDSPAKKPRKTPAKKPETEDGAEKGTGTNGGADDGNDGETEKPAKNSRKSTVKKEKENAGVASAVSPAGETGREKKPGPKRGTANANKVVAVVIPTKPVAFEEEVEQRETYPVAASKVVEVAKLADAALGGRRIAGKVASTTEATVGPPNWGTPVNGQSQSPSKAQAVAQKELANGRGMANDGVENNVVILTSEIMESIEKDEDDSGDTIIVATQ